MFNAAIHIVSPEKKNVMTHKKTISAFVLSISISLTYMYFKKYHQNEIKNGTF